MADALEAKESPLVQRASEAVAYSLVTTPWASDPSLPAVTVELYDPTDRSWSDVTDNTTSGAASVSGDTITTPLLEALEAGKTYRVTVQFVAGGMTLRPFFRVIGSE